MTKNDVIEELKEKIKRVTNNVLFVECTRTNTMASFFESDFDNLLGNLSFLSEQFIIFITLSQPQKDSDVAIRAVIPQLNIEFVGMYHARKKRC